MEEKVSSTTVDEQYPDESYTPFQSQPLGHSRPFYYQQEAAAAYSHRAQPPYHQQIGYDSPVRYNGFKDDSFRQASSTSDSYGLLGSGNFGVIKGGTFYANNKGSGDYSNFEGDFNSYFHNGHGRPSYHIGGPPNPRPYQHEQFANFKDFADINTPTDRQYSQYVVVYVNKNGTKNDEEVKNNKPKNIFESLQLLDREDSSDYNTMEDEEGPEKKLSMSKRKLKKLLPEKKHKLKKTKIPDRDYEPLLALS